MRTLGQIESGYRYQGNDCRTDSGKHGGDDRIILELMEEHRDEQDNQERGESCPECGTDSSSGLAQFVADEDADVDSEDAGTTLCNGYQVEKLFLVHPFVSVDDVGFNHRNHGIATAKGDESNLEKCLE